MRRVVEGPAQAMYRVGLPVRYSSVIGQEPDDRIWTIRDAGVMAGRRVYWLQGKAGCVAEEALTPVADEAGA